MKTKVFLLSLLALGGAFASSCTTAPQPVATNRDIELRPSGDRSYSDNQLRKTGRQTAGEALAEVDPAVYITGNH